MDDSTPIDTIRDLYAKCMERLDFLSSEEPYASQAWEVEFDRLRTWGQNLERSSGPAPTPLEDQLQSSLPLQNRLLEALEGLFTGLKAFTDKLQRATAGGFKIAGIDVLSANSNGEERQNAARFEDITRRLHVTARDINTLYSIFNAPTRPLSNGRLMPRPQRSYSNRDDSYEPNELMSSASASPMAPPGRSKRTRGDSMSSRDESVYSSSAYRVSSGSESLSQRYSDARYSDTRYSDTRYSDTKYSDSRFSDQRYSDLPSIHSIPSRESLEPSPYDPHASTGSRLSGPYFGPPAGIQPQGPTSMYPIPDRPPYMSYDSSRSHDSRGDEPLGYHEQGPMGSHSPHSERALSRGATRSMGRLRMPGDSGDDGSSGTPTPKLTKTGRVSKALRGEAVHACTICDKVYTRAEHLRRHRQNHRVSGPAAVA